MELIGVFFFSDRLNIFILCLRISYFVSLLKFSNSFFITSNFCTHFLKASQRYPMVLLNGFMSQTEKSDLSRTNIYNISSMAKEVKFFITMKCYSHNIYKNLISKVLFFFIDYFNTQRVFIFV